MRLSTILMFLVFVSAVLGQEKDLSLFSMAKSDDVWRRIATMDDGYSEINTNAVLWGQTDSEDVGQVLFRFVYDKPTPVSANTALKYKTEEFIVHFKCNQRRWRTSERRYLDAKGKVVHSTKAEAGAEC